MAKSKNARRRNADATRAAILLSARQAFARAGYDGVGLREIGAAAGVTAMMVNRYFGSKEELFAAVVANVMENPIILTPDNLDSDNLAAAMAHGVVAQTAPGATPLDGFLIMMHSASSARAAKIARDQIETHYQRQLATALKGSHTEQRAAVALAMVAGIQVMRQVIGLKALSAAKPATLTAILLPLFESLINGTKQRGSLSH